MVLIVTVIMRIKLTITFLFIKRNKRLWSKRENFSYRMNEFWGLRGHHMPIVTGTVLYPGELL